MRRSVPMQKLALFLLIGSCFLLSENIIFKTSPSELTNIENLELVSSSHARRRRRTVKKVSVTRKKAPAKVVKKKKAPKKVAKKKSSKKKSKKKSSKRKSSGGGFFSNGATFSLDPMGNCGWYGYGSC